MQTIKDEIKLNILKAARAEFLEHDFEKASIRRIAAKADTSKSNIYNYFKNKDDLFCSVVKPVMDIIQQVVASKHKEYKNDIQQQYTYDNQKEIIEVVMTFVYQNKDDFILLLFKSKGSSHEDFRTRIKQLYVGVMMNWLELVDSNKKPSPFFIESVADFYINIVSNMILEDLSIEQIYQYFDEFLVFVYGGWERILNSGSIH